jgi:hypothetical protein
LKRLMAKFLKRFSTTSSSSSAHPEAVRSPEAITRFIFSSEQFASKTGRVKASAIGPIENRATGRLETSVYRSEGATAQELWAVCAAYVDAPARRRVAKARGTCAALVYLSQRLTIDANGKPHPRHADVIGWPVESTSRRFCNKGLPLKWCWKSENPWKANDDVSSRARQASEMMAPPE